MLQPLHPSQPRRNQASNLAADHLVLEYLRARGHKSAERALTEALGSSRGQREILSHYIRGMNLSKNSPSLPKNLLSLEENTPQDNPWEWQKELASAVNSSNLQNLIASIGPVGAEEILSLDPNDKQEGFRELEAWVEGSLDIYRVRSTRSFRYLLLTT